MENNKLPLGYLGGNIMGHGDVLAREEEANKFDAADLNVEYYSPIRNKSINDKKNVTEEENNHLAEKITEADIDRLWNSDFTVMCPEQAAIGTMCETGCLYGWKYMTDKLIEIFKESQVERVDPWEETCRLLMREICRINEKMNYFHYSDIRTNHLNEKDWRRSFSINQLLYGMILYASADGTLHDNFDEILPELERIYGKKENN